MKNDPAARTELARGKRLLGFAGLFGVIAISIGIPFYMKGGAASAPPAPVGSLDNIFASLFFVTVGTIVLILGIGLWAIVWATRCFTFNFQRPFMPSFGRKLWFANIVVTFGD